MVEKIIANKEDLIVIANALREAEGTTTEYNVPQLGEAAAEAIRSASKIITTTEDPGEGASVDYADGTVIYVYE